MKRTRKTRKYYQIDKIVSGERKQLQVATRKIHGWLSKAKIHIKNIS